MADSSDPGLRLKPSFYARPDFFTTDVARGVTRTPAGTRVCALSSDFLRGFRDAVIYECGKAYRRVLKQAGRRWGVQFARRFDRELTAYYQAPLRSLSAGLVHACLADAFNYHGWGKLTVDLADLGHGFLTVTVANAALPALVTEADRPVDLLMAGLLAAVFAHLAGADLDAVQTECPSMGAEAERFVVGPAARIKEIEQWLATAAPHAAVPHAAVVERLRAAAAAAPEEAE